MEGRVWLISLAFGALMTVTAIPADDGPLKYPPTRRGDQVDDYHGVKVPDPYRWLEEDVRKSDEVRQWVEEQNKVTNKYLDSIPERKGIQKRLTELWNYEKYSTPFNMWSCWERVRPRQSPR